MQHDPSLHGSSRGAATTDTSGEGHRPEPGQTLRRIEGELVWEARLSNATSAELLSMHVYISAEAERARKYVSDVAGGTVPLTAGVIETAMREGQHLGERRQVLERIERELAAPGRLANATTLEQLKLHAHVRAVLNQMMSHFEEAAASEP